MQPAHEIVSKDEGAGVEGMRPFEISWQPVRACWPHAGAVVQDAARRVPAGQSCPLAGWWCTPQGQLLSSLQAR